jgi:2-dehydropantoate 2-reductase
MRYVVVGAGGVGGTIGGRLFQAGHDVVLVARGAHAEALRRDGLRLRDPDSDARLAIPTVTDPSGVDWDPGADVAVLATKVQQAEAALTALAAAAPPDTPVVCATNGLEAERLALRRFARVLAMAVLLPAEHLVPGEVTAYSSPVTGVLDVGRYPTGVDEVAEAVSADLAGATFASRADSAVLERKRTKLRRNLANVLDAACGPADTADLWAAARDVALACYQAAGVDHVALDDDAARRAESGMRLRPVDGGRRQGGSTWQSLARGTGDTEADFLNGEIVLLGRLHGVATPVNAVLQQVARELATAGRPPGSLTPDDLRARVA